MSGGGGYGAYRQGAGAPKPGSEAPQLPILAKSMQPIFNLLWHRFEEAREQMDRIEAELKTLREAVLALADEETGPSGDSSG